MKNNILKYVFFIFIIIISIFIVYTINNQNAYKKQKNIQSTSIQKQEEPEQILNLGIAEFDTFNPILSNNKYIQSISKVIYEPLLTINNNYKLENCIALEWAKTSELTYLIKLKENVKWSNGDSCTAEDVLYTIELLKEITNIYSHNVQDIALAEVIDKHTIKITLSKEITLFEYNLNFPIMSKNYFGEDNFEQSEKSKSPLGTGSYVIAEIQDSKIILAKNPNYWNIENNDAKILNIKINLYNSVGEMYNDFKLGKLDLVNTSNISVQEYIGTIGYNKIEDIGREHDYIAFNMKNNVLSNLEIRQAINCCIDKSEITSSVYGGKYVKANFPLAENHWLYQGSKENNYNVEKANQILLDNGWEFKYNFWQKNTNYNTKKLNFRLVVNLSNPERVQVAEIIKNQLELIGIKISIIKVNDYTYNNYKKYKNYDMILCGTILGTSPDLSRYFEEGNISGFYNEEAKAIINDLKNITDEELLKQKYKRLFDIYTSEIPYISLYHNYAVTAYSKNLAGAISANWYNIFYNIANWSKK